MKLVPFGILFPVSCKEALDEDLSTTLWREDLAHLDVITIDRFTEKVFMADPEFMQRFRGTIDDVFPGFTTYEPLKDESIEGHWDAILQRSILDEADLIERKVETCARGKTPSAIFVRVYPLEMT